MLITSWFGVLVVFAAGVVAALSGVAIVYVKRFAQGDQLLRPRKNDTRHSHVVAKMPQPTEALPDLQVLGLLCATVAHDFNNLLAVIATNAASLKAQTSGQALEEADEIQQATVRATDLCRQLLKLGAERTEETEAVELNALIEAELPLLRRFVSRRVLVLWEPGPDVHVFAAGTAFRQLLLNLCANARDAMPNGGNLHISTRVDARRGPVEHASQWFAVLAVRDDGAGMDAATRERLFEPFFTTKSASEGTGLGMSVVAAAADRHNATIDVESELGRGTTISVRFPISEQQVAADARLSHVASCVHESIEDEADAPSTVAC